MAEFEFTFVVSGLNAENDAVADRFFEAGCDDATLMLINGLFAVCFTREATSYADAVVSAHHNVSATGAKIERFEPDFLVSKAEIAKRAHLSRSAISLYVAGERGSGFPPPHARITTSSPLWDWVDVSKWLYTHGEMSLDTVVEAQIGRAVNLYVEAHQHAGPYTKQSLEEVTKTAEQQALAAA